MSEAAVEPIAPDDIEAIHGILERDFTDRYLKKAKITGYAYSQSYDPGNEFCDYDKTWWPAHPSARLGVPLGNLILGRLMNGIPRQQVDEMAVRPFEGRGSHLLSDRLQQFPVMLVNGHEPDMLAGLTLFGFDIALARRDSRERSHSFSRNYRDMARISHVIGTRGFAPIMIGRENIPGHIPIVRLAQLVFNSHLSFPKNEAMMASGIPPEFRGEYNGRMRDNYTSITQTETKHPWGYHVLGSFAPSGTRDVKGVGDHAGKMIMPMVDAATIRFAAETGCALLPIRSSLRKEGGKQQTKLEMGWLVPPNEVDDQTLHGIMAELAAFRRRHGEKNVYYAGELAA